MIMIPGPIPIAIHPFFWLFAALVGWLYGQSIMGMFIWVGIIFFSVLIHELGHALTAVFFRQKAKIQLVAFGGLTTYDSGPNLNFWQQFIIVFNGPLFGFGLCFFSFLLLKTPLPPIGIAVCQASFVANLFWSAVNLLPILPLDGGQLLRIALEGFFGLKGFRASLLIGTVLSGLMTGAAFVFGYFIAGAFFFLFAFQSFDSWRKSRLATGDDRTAENNALMLRAEQALQEGRKEEARKFFEEIALKSGHGILAVTANQYLAFFDMQQGKKEAAYEKLLPIKDQLAEESICLLHQLAFEHDNDPLVADLSARCYQMVPTQEVALRNARSFARLGQPTPAGGWLQTAWQHGEFNLEQVLNEAPFTQMKNDPLFIEFINPLR
jgi:stage IV sporulation protein FB